MGEQVAIESQMLFQGKPFTDEEFFRSDGFEAFVGVRWTLSELDIAVWWPSEESWARADRTIVCTVMSDTGDQLTGTQRGTNR